MPIGGEQAWDLTPNSITDGGLSTATFDIDMPPSAAFIKVFLGKMFVDFGSDGSFLSEFNVDPNTVPSAVLGLINMRRRKPDNSDEAVIFPDLLSLDSVSVMFDSAMTHVTFGISLQTCQASLIWTLEFWG